MYSIPFIEDAMPTYHDVNSLTPQQQEVVRSLYRSVGWWFAADEDKPELIERIIAGSHCFCIALEENQIIGIGRAISDGIIDAYIQDVVVHENYRRQGIGTALVQHIIDILTKNGIDWIGLIASPGSESLYRKLGFRDMPHHAAMRFK